MPKDVSITSICIFNRIFKNLGNIPNFLKWGQTEIVKTKSFLKKFLIQFFFFSINWQIFYETINQVSHLYANKIFWPINFKNYKILDAHALKVGSNGNPLSKKKDGRHYDIIDQIQRSFCFNFVKELINW